MMEEENISFGTQDILEKSEKLLKHALGDQSRLQRSPANAFRDNYEFSRSKMQDVVQSTRLRAGLNSPSHLFDTDMSITVTPTELKKMTDTKAFLSGKYDNPLAQSAQDQLFIDFMEVWQRSTTSVQDIFGSIYEFIECCSNAIELIRGSEDLSLAPLSAIDEKRLTEIEAEKNTWKLIYALYQDRNISLDENMDENMDILDIENVSEKNIMERLYKRDSNVREWQIVIDWLERNALEGLSGPGLERYTDKAIAWENTLHELQNKKAVPYRSTREFITELDPDAPRRQNKHLHDMDQEDEDRLLMHILKEIRCGRLGEAQSLCVHAGQLWHAAVLEGWKLYHDPNYFTPSNPVSREKLPVEGNPNRDVWKLCAWKMCEDGSRPLRARAALGAYCGHLSTLLSVSTSWEDQLWSYLKTQVDIRVEREIRACSMKTYVEMPPSYWNNEMTIESVFNEISSSKDRNVRKESATPDHVVQRAVILDDVPKLAGDISKWISGSDMSVGHDTESVSPHFLRFLAHFVLFLRSIPRSGVESIGDAVIEAYVRLLIEKRESRLVAWYVSQLSQNDQVYFYSSFLEEITEAEEREAALKAAVEAGLDVDLITKTVVESIRQQPCNVDNVGLEIQEVSPEDAVKISALDWLRFYPSQRVELLIQANALIAFFLASGNVVAARMAFNKVPGDLIGLIQLQARSFDEDLNLDPDNPVDLATREYLCYKTYLDAEESFSDWFEHFHHAKPVEPVLNAGYTFIEKVNYQHRHKQYKADLERWKQTMDNQTKTTKALLFNVLTFPLGWLVDDTVTEDPDRTAQMNALRSIIIPKVTFLLHLVMHSMEDYAGCVALADVIASSHGKLYKTFNKQRLQDLLQKIAESSLALMNNGKDPWGFSQN